MILIGYHSTGAYKLYDPIHKKVVVSNDVIVDETREWNWKESTEQATSKVTSIQLDSDRVEDEEEVNVPEPTIPDDDNVNNANENNVENMDNDNVEQLRRSDRVRFPSVRLQGYALYPVSLCEDVTDIMHLVLMVESEPISLDQALSNPKWKEAMVEELRSIEKNETWQMVNLPSNKRVIDVKWVYKTKMKPNGEIAKYKARLVAKGFLQQPGLDFNEIYAPVARIETVKLIVALASLRKWSLNQLDVKSAFLNGPLEEEVYVKQAPGFEKKGMENKVMKLKKALYGLKHAPRAWNKKIDASLQKLNFTKCSTEHGAYVRLNINDGLIIICLYVDDLLVIGSNE